MTRKPPKRPGLQPGGFKRPPPRMPTPILRPPDRVAEPITVSTARRALARIVTELPEDVCATLRPAAATQRQVITSVAQTLGAAPAKTGTLESRTLREWFKAQPCQLAGVEGHRAGFHGADDPHHVTSRGRIGRQDLLVVGVCREGHEEAHAGKISRAALKVAAYDALVFFIASADRETKRRVLREMFGEENP